MFGPEARVPTQCRELLHQPGVSRTLWLHLPPYLNNMIPASRLFGHSAQELMHVWAQFGGTWRDLAGVDGIGKLELMFYT